MKDPEIPAHQFEVEHGSEPHCFACRERVVPGDEIYLHNLGGTVIWWHLRCADQTAVAKALKGEPL